MSFWKKTMDYLGLGPDDAYDDYDDQVEPEPASRSSRSSGASGSQGGRSSAKAHVAGGVRRDRRSVPCRPVRASRRATSSRRPRRAAPRRRRLRGAPPVRPSGRRRPRVDDEPGASRRPSGRAASTRRRSWPTSSRTGSR